MWHSWGELPLCGKWCISQLGITPWTSGEGIGRDSFATGGTIGILSLGVEASRGGGPWIETLLLRRKQVRR